MDNMYQRMKDELRSPGDGPIEVVSSPSEASEEPPPASEDPSPASEEPPPTEEAGTRTPEARMPPTSPDANRCRVCLEDFGERERARCPGCVMRVHRDVCSTYLGIGIKYEIGMCNFCCAKVSTWLEEIRESIRGTDTRFDEDRWMRKLLKSQKEGCALSLTRNSMLNELQHFIWKGLNQGLKVRIFTPFLPAGHAAVESVSSRSSGLQFESAAQYREYRRQFLESQDMEGEDADVNSAQMRGPGRQPNVNGPQEARAPFDPQSRQESGTQGGATAQAAGSSGDVPGARSSRDVRGQRQQQELGGFASASEPGSHSNCGSYS